LIVHDSVCHDVIDDKSTYMIQCDSISLFTCGENGGQRKREGARLLEEKNQWHGGCEG